MKRPPTEVALFMLRCLLGLMFIAHLYWKMVLFAGGLPGWWEGLVSQGYPSLVPAYVFSAELAGAVLLIPGIFTRYVAIYALPMMVGAAQFWLVRTGFYFTKAGAELPLVWASLLIVQAVGGDGAFALPRSSAWRGFQRSSTSRP
jgi:putative oxidoreductase